MLNSGFRAADWCFRTTSAVNIGKWEAKGLLPNETDVGASSTHSKLLTCRDYGTVRFRDYQATGLQTAAAPRLGIDRLRGLYLGLKFWFARFDMKSVQVAGKPATANFP